MALCFTVTGQRKSTNSIDSCHNVARAKTPWNWFSSSGRENLYRTRSASYLRSASVTNVFIMLIRLADRGIDPTSTLCVCVCVCVCVWRGEMWGRLSFNCTGGVWGGCAPGEAWNSCIFATGIVQFSKIHFDANLEQAMSKTHSSLCLTDQNFVLWEKSLIKLCKNH